MKSVLITGASRGIGFELAKYFAENSWQVYACCRHPRRAGALLGLSPNVSVLKLDVASPHSIRRLAKKLRNIPLDVLINNAGLMEPIKAGFSQHILRFRPYKPWFDVFKVNTMGPFFMTQALFKNLLLGKKLQEKTDPELTSKIIVANISSDMGSMNDDKLGGYYIYRSSKAALNAITKSLAIDFQTLGVAVIALHPGWVKTDMGGLHAKISAGESAKGIYHVLNNLEPKESGKFLDYKGQTIAW